MFSTVTGITHDWVLFLRGPSENPDIQSFIRKVVFNLHASFQNPIRVVDKPPYEVRESGYAGFVAPIMVYLKGLNDDVPSKIRFDYNLAFNANSSCNYLQTEKITFRNPSFEFRRRLLDGGGCGVLDDNAEALISKPKFAQVFARCQQKTPGISFRTSFVPFL